MPSGPVDVPGRQDHPSAAVGPTTPSFDRFQILALDGGGAKALFTAQVLARLEQDLDVSIKDSFDLIAGTSAGGIVALALGAGLTPSEIVEHYEELVEAVFPATRRRLWRRARQLTAPIYDADALRTALTKVLGERLLGDSAKRLVIPAWDVQRGAVHIFKTPHHKRLARDWRLSMVDIAMATSAAPLYFPAARVDGHRLIDGGVWANNPSVVAIAEAVSMLDVPLASIRVLNVGTIDQLTNHPKRLDRGGLFNWAKPIAPLILNAGSRGGQGIAEHLIGKDAYTRFDARVPGDLYALDSADPDDIAGLAASVSRELSPVYTARFATHRAAEYTPLIGDPRRGHPTSTSTTEVSR
ncbi:MULTISPECIES: CBASS cGAMP-activated phospholipase [Actinomycetes]|uniref:CBASS cGAMP-activated phospholipase n=1 Tax=Mycobacteriales TaxID=85007 RepID=UPI000A56B665|nr:CBASS cGAMP-activated phospholipase [Dietzia cinnamea]MCT2263876.1 patatin-like phospholipase family protein [Dietzia cinnamea]